MQLMMSRFNVRSRALRLAVLALIMAASLNAGVLAQDGSAITSVAAAVGDLPTSGGMRPGPVGMQPPGGSPRVGVEPSASTADPTAIRSEQAKVDAPIEPLQIIDGAMQNPSGPFVVGWYVETAQPGAAGNAVMAGHVDYWNVGAAVFWELPPPRQALAEGDPIIINGANGEEYTYAVSWQKMYDLADLTPEIINGEIVGPTDVPSLTLITCGGPFDPVSGQYLSRYVIRATLVG